MALGIGEIEWNLGDFVQVPARSKLGLFKRRTPWYIRPTASNELYRQRIEGLRLKNVPLAEVWQCKGVRLIAVGSREG